MADMLMAVGGMSKAEAEHLLRMNGNNPDAALNAHFTAKPSFASVVPPSQQQQQPADPFNGLFGSAPPPAPPTAPKLVERVVGGWRVQQPPQGELYGNRMGLFATYPQMGREEPMALPLSGLAVEGAVGGGVVSATVRQRYVNRSTESLEVRFVFDAEHFQVAGLALRVDGRSYKGAVKGTEDAEDDFEDAVAQGAKAALLTRESTGEGEVFSLRVGSMGPGAEAEVVLRVIGEASAISGIEGNLATLTLPFTRTALFEPPPAAERGSNTLVADAPPAPEADKEGLTGLSVALALNMASKVVRVDCPSHKIEGALDGPSANIRIADPSGAGSARKALVLQVEVADPFLPTATLATLPPADALLAAEKEGGCGWGLDGTRAAGAGCPHAVGVAFQPRVVADGEEPEEEWMARELIFVVDRSGSMSGARIEQARNALQLFLRSIPQGCSFNIIGFGSRHTNLWPQSRPYNATTLKQATDHVMVMRADLGGTNLLDPLRSVLSTRAKGSLPRQVFVITDGDVGDKTMVIKHVRENACPATRVFTLGIGAEASERLVRGMAIAGRGESAFALSGERVEPKVLGQLGRALAPALTELRVDWGGLKVVEGGEGGIGHGDSSKPVFEGQGVSRFALLSELPAAPVTVTLHCKRGKQALESKVEVGGSGASAVTTPIFHLAAAAARVGELEAAAKAPGAEGQPPAAAIEKEGRALSCTWGLVSKFASYIAVETTPTGDAAQSQPKVISANTGLEVAGAQPNQFDSLFGISQVNGLTLGAQSGMGMGYAPPGSTGMGGGFGAGGMGGQQFQQQQQQQQPPCFGAYAQQGPPQNTPLPQPQSANFYQPQMAAASAPSYAPPPHAPQARRRQAKGSRGGGHQPVPLACAPARSAAPPVPMGAAAPVAQQSAAVDLDDLFGAPAAPMPQRQIVQECASRFDAYAPEPQMEEDEEECNQMFMFSAAPAPTAAAADLFDEAPTPAASPPTSPTTSGDLVSSAPPISPQMRPVDVVAAHQQAEGWFGASAALAERMGVGADKVDAYLGAGSGWRGGRLSRREGCLWTALVLAFLANRLGGSEVEWRLLAQKARRWLGREAGGCGLQGGVDGLLAQAKALL